VLATVLDLVTEGQAAHNTAVRAGDVAATVRAAQRTTAAVLRAADASPWVTQVAALMLLVSPNAPRAVLTADDAVGETLTFNGADWRGPTVAYTIVCHDLESALFAQLSKDQGAAQQAQAELFKDLFANVRRVAEEQLEERRITAPAKLAGDDEPSKPN